KSYCADRSARPPVDPVVVAPLRKQSSIAVILRSGNIADVADDRRRFEPHGPTGAVRSPAPIEVLGVHEQPFVEPTELFEGGTPEQQRRPVRPVDWAWLVMS